MNCQDVNEILDNLRWDRIYPWQRHQAEGHVATCANCARAWNAQATLAALPDESMPTGLQAQCLAAVAARVSPAKAADSSSRRRVLMWGSLATTAAAAATLALLPWPEAATVPADDARALGITAAAPFADDAAAVQPTWAQPSTQAGLANAAALETAVSPRFTVQLVVPEPPPVELEELHANATAPGARDALQSLRAALAGELRKVPGLAMVDKDPAQSAAPSRHYRLKLGPLLGVGVDGRPMRKEHQYDMALDVQEVQPGGKVIERVLATKLFTVEPHATCTSPDAAERTPCDVTTTARYLARHLREQAFPPDASTTRPLQARFRDFSVAPEERFNNFVELFRQQAKVGGKDLLGDAGVVRAAVELSQLTDASHRRQLWRAMRGVGDAVLVEPLVASMQQDPADTRIAAVETLGADFSGDERARLALEVAANSDPLPLVRALARRGLSGEAGWQNYVISSLKDSTLPASQRVEALLHELYPPDAIDGVSDPSRDDYWQILEGLDAASVRALAEVFPEAEQLRKWPGNNLVGNFAAKHHQNPAVTEMLLTVLEHDTGSLNHSVAGEALAQRHADKARVRAALLRAASSDPDASVRDYLRQVLERDYVKKAMASAAN